MFARIGAVMDRPRARVPWLIVAGSALLAILFLYVLFGAYMPAKQRMARLEDELKETYAREAALQTKVAQQDARLALRDQQMTALVAERDALAQRLEQAQRAPASARRPGRRR
jgi:C4-dicarboxylate-specific signal transduction histidine kinase